jgi:hypothetical protein
MQDADTSAGPERPGTGQRERPGPDRPRPELHGHSGQEGRPGGHGISLVPDPLAEEEMRAQLE